MTVKIESFRGDFGFLSNFHMSSFTYGGKTWPSVEHAYQAMKSLDPTTQEMIRKVKTPGEAKKLGKGVALRPNWDIVKFAIMDELLRAKFRNPLLKAMLLATEDAELIEGNSWNDTVWGVCRGVGENHLGRLLMTIRSDLKTEVDEDNKDFGK